MLEKSTLFPRTFIGVISLVEKYILPDSAKYLSFSEVQKKTALATSLDQILGRMEFVLNLVQNRSVGASFW